MRLDRAVISKVDDNDSLNFLSLFSSLFSDTTNTHYPLYWVHLASNRFDPLLPSELH